MKVSLEIPGECESSKNEEYGRIDSIKELDITSKPREIMLSHYDLTAEAL